MAKYDNFKDDPIIVSTVPPGADSSDDQQKQRISSICQKLNICKEFRREYVNYMLLNRFPIKMLVISAVFFTLSNLALIAAQLFGMLANVPFYYLGAGVWIGIYMIILQVIAAYLCTTPKYKLVIVLFVGYILAIISNVVFNVVLNIYAILNPCPDTSLFDICMESSFVGLNLTLLILGMSNTVFSLVFVFLLKLKLIAIMKLFVYPSVY